MEGVRARGHARPGRQCHHHLLDREFRRDGGPHRRLDYGSPADDAVRPAVPGDAGRGQGHHSQGRRRHRRVEHPVRRGPANRPPCRHRNEPARLALLGAGYTLDEIPNDITKKTPACFEPSLDYVVVKIPRWTFEKFPKADPRLTIQMKSVGEAMAIGRTFAEALGKAIRSLEIGRDGLDDGRESVPIEELLSKLEVPTWERIFHVRRAFLAGMSVEEVADRTRIDPWFLDAIRKMVREEKCLAGKSPATLSREEVRRCKRLGLSDAAIGRAMGCGEAAVRVGRRELGVIPVSKTIDTCAAEFEAYTPYYYSTYE